MSWWKILLIAVVLAALAGLAYWRWNAGLPVVAEAPQRREIAQYIDERGKTRLPREFVVTMPQDGRIEPIQLEVGDVVRADQVVARIVPGDLDRAVEEARALVARFEASIAENEDNAVEQRARQQAERFVESMRADVQAARSREEASASRLAYARHVLDRIRSLIQTNASNLDELQAAESAVDVNEAEAGEKANTLKSTQLMAAAAELLPSLIDDYLSRKRLTREVLVQQKREAEQRLEEMLTRRERGVMRSPVEGVVIAREVVNERYLAAGTVLLKIGRLADLEVEVDVLSQEMGGIRVGGAAAIYGAAVDRDPQQALAGVVTRIHPAGFTKISSLGVEQQRVKVIVGFAEESLSAVRELQLGVDYRLRVRFVTASRQNALTVPRSAIFRHRDGGWQVFVVRGGRLRLESIRIGLVNDEHAEVLDGIDEHDRVVVTPESRLVAGLRVTPLATP